jgi:hypothetical protein
MRFKGFTSLSLLLVMLLAQLTLAQHYTVHDHDISSPFHQEHDDNTPTTGEKCQIFIFAKGLSNSLISQAVEISSPYIQPLKLIITAQTFIIRNETSDYQARAPPRFLS